MSFIWESRQDTQDEALKSHCRDESEGEWVREQRMREMREIDIELKQIKEDLK